MTSADHESPREYILVATCAAQRGVIAAITTCLAKHDCYILSLEQFDDEMNGRFFMRAVFRIENRAVEVDQVCEEMNGVAGSLNMQWGIHTKDALMSVLLMVSKFDHCLADLLYRVKTGDLRMNITAVVSNHEELRPLVEHMQHEFIHLPVTKETKPTQEKRLLDIIRKTGTELVVLARYMQILSDDLARKLHGRCINIHHSFLPGFKGARPYHQAFERGVKLIGATAHYVTGDLDEGPIIEQQVTRVGHYHTPEDLVRLGRDTESLVLASAVKLHLERRVFLDGNKTVIFQSS